MIVDLRPPRGFEHGAGGMGEGFSGAYHPLYTDFFGGLSHLFGGLGHVKSIGGGIQKGGCSDLHHLVDPTDGIQRTARHHIAPKLLRCIVPFPERNIDIVSKGDKDPVGFPETGHP